MKDQFFLRNRFIFAFDLVLIAMSVMLSFLLRLEITQVFVDYAHWLSSRWCTGGLACTRVSGCMPAYVNW
jgi:hypothetical protein